MPEPITYSLYLSRYIKFLIFGLLLVLTIVGLLFVTALLSPSATESSSRLFGLFWLAIVSLNWYWILSLPFKITLHETGEVNFISLIRSKNITLPDIKSIKPDPAQFGFLLIRTSHGKIRILHQFDGFHDFIFKVKNINPSAELRGC